MSHLHQYRRLAIAAGAALAVGAGAAPALAASAPQTQPTRTLKSEIKQAESTPLGAAIVHQGNLITIDSSLTRAHIKAFAANLAARKHAEAVIRAITPESTGHQAEIKREWLKGAQFLVASDESLLRYLHGSQTGKTANQERVRGLNEGTDGSDLTGWAFNALWGKPGPLPRT